MISSHQMRAARALLGWSQTDLADASDVSTPTINKFEQGGAINTDKLRDAYNILLRNNIEFLEDDGVKRRPKAVRILQGPTAAEAFYDDVFAVIKNRQGTIAGIFSSEQYLLKALAATDHAGLERMKRLTSLGNFQCLLFDAQDTIVSTPYIHFRAIGKNPHAPLMMMTYGDRIAMIAMSDMEPAYYVTHNAALAQESFKSFEADWNTAVTLKLPPLVQARLILNQ